MNIMLARVKALKSDDGLVEFEDHVELGRMYYVDLDSIENMTMYNTDYGCIHTRPWIRVIDHGAPAGMLPLELLEFTK